MNKPIGCFLALALILAIDFCQSQDLIKSNIAYVTPKVFDEDWILPLKLSFAIKDIKKDTNDSTYLDSNLNYRLKDSTWKSLAIGLRKRGNNRLKNCYFPPLKIKLKPSDVEDTPFEGHKNLKIVMPCLLQSDKNDNVVKEYLAYRFFEIISPYHFKTRLLDIAFDESRGSRTKARHLKGIMIEDDKILAKRFDGKVYDRHMHPKNQEPLSCIRNAIFQFMIGNTDFSQAYQHNIKVIYINRNMIPVPYDFDMSGFVNTSYAVVSVIQGESLDMASVTERKYRGFERDIKLFEQVRREFLDHKEKLLQVLDDNAAFFDDPKEFETARVYILDFYEIMANDQRFRKAILDQVRTN